MFIEFFSSLSSSSSSSSSSLPSPLIAVIGRAEENRVTAGTSIFSQDLKVGLLGLSDLRGQTADPKKEKKKGEKKNVLQLTPARRAAAAVALAARC